jgi:CHAD domain-containing protein
MDHRAAILVLLKQRLETILETMPAAQAGDVRSVHQARVATRRLREALPVLGTAIDTGAVTQLRRQVRRMTRALGPVRELDVALLHLEEFAKRGGVSARAIARVRQSLTEQRLARRGEMLIAVTPGRVEKLRDRLGQLGSRSAAPQAPAALAEADRHVSRRARRLAEAVGRAGGLYMPERLHAVRIAAKKLRYAMEIARELKRSRATARISQVKRLQDLLGRIHDFEILIERTRQVQTEATATDRRIATDLDALVHALEGECRTDHGIYMRRRASILKLCETLNLSDERPSTAVA